MKEHVTVMAAIDRHAQTRGQRVALHCGDQSLTYAELAHEVRVTLERLEAAGLDGSRPIAVLAENCIEIMLLYYAVALQGGRIIPINSSLTAKEVEYILWHGEAARLFYDDRSEHVATAALAASTSPPGSRFAEFFVERAHGVPSGERAARSPGATFLLVYTSGSTGSPKGVGMAQADEVAGNASLIEMWDVQPDDVMVVALPMGWHYGLTTATGMILQAGGKAVILDRFHPQRVLEAIVAHRATFFEGVPTMYAMMVEYAQQNAARLDLSAMKSLVSAGAPLSGVLAEQFATTFGKRLDNYYALTESRPIFGMFAGDPAPPPGAAGKLAPRAMVRIVDKDGQDVPDGVEGEMYVRGLSATSGYLKAPELTAQLYHQGLIRSGDLGHRNADGYYFLTGRSKDIIIRGGANISPLEVEQALAQHPQVLRAAVIGIPDAKYGQLVTAYLVTAPGVDLPDDQILDFCRGQLAEFKLPAHLIRLSALPLGPTGKVDKKALQALWLKESS